MNKASFAGAEGYAGNSAPLIKKYNAIPFLVKHEPVLHLLPKMPCDVLDIGAGTGADAAWFAEQGCSVVAVEPVSEFLKAAQQLHPCKRIQWYQDGLPALSPVVALGQVFDIVLLSAVWMHLDEAERQRAMPTIASLLSISGVLIISLRHGPVPEGRRMYDVSSEETVSLAKGCGLQVLLDIKTPSVQSDNQKAGVMWSRLVFRRNGHKAKADNGL